MEKIDFMQELYKLIIERLRKEAFSVIILLGVIGALWVTSQDQKTELKTHAEKWDSERNELFSQIQHCNMERSALAVEVASLKLRVEMFLSNQKILRR